MVGKRILMTGGAGFIGTRLTERLIDENEIIVLDTLHRDALSGSPLISHPNMTFVQGDILDAELVRDVAEGVGVIVHLAAVAGVDAVLENPVHTMRVGLIGTGNVLDAAKRNLGTIERFIDFSTSEVFGRYAYRVEETHVTTQEAIGEARWTYAVSKLAGEYMAHAYYDQYKLPVVSVRPFNVYGPGQVGDGAIHSFIRTALQGRDLTVYNGGTAIRAWCYIDDLVDALLLCLDRPEAVGQVFNIGNENSVLTIRELALRIKNLIGGVGLVFERLDYADVEMRIPNVDKARELLGWAAQVDLDEGLAATIDWYKSAYLAAA